MEPCHSKWNRRGGWVCLQVSIYVLGFFQVDYSYWVGGSAFLVCLDYMCKPEQEHERCYSISWGIIALIESIGLCCNTIPLCSHVKLSARLKIKTLVFKWAGDLFCTLPPKDYHVLTLRMSPTEQWEFPSKCLWKTFFNDNIKPLEDVWLFARSAHSHLTFEA